MRATHSQSSCLLFTILYGCSKTAKNCSIERLLLPSMKLLFTSQLPYSLSVYLHPSYKLPVQWSFLEHSFAILKGRKTIFFTYINCFFSRLNVFYRHNFLTLSLCTYIERRILRPPLSLLRIQLTSSKKADSFFS